MQRSEKWPPFFKMADSPVTSQSGNKWKIVLYDIENIYSSKNCFRHDDRPFWRLPPDHILKKFQDKAPHGIRIDTSAPINKTGAKLWNGFKRKPAEFALELRNVSNFGHRKKKNRVSSQFVLIISSPTQVTPRIHPSVAIETLCDVTD